MTGNQSREDLIEEFLQQEVVAPVLEYLKGTQEELELMVKYVNAQTFGAQLRVVFRYAGELGKMEALRTLDTNAIIKTAETYFAFSAESTVKHYQYDACMNYTKIVVFNVLKGFFGNGE